jgi:hypothetical protein
VLNFSKNFVTDKAIKSIAAILDGSYRVEEVYLHWNQIKAPGGQILFKTLLDNENLRVLDLSSNSLGMSGSCVSDLSDFIIRNKDLRHLDLSSNYFGKQDTQSISDALNQNQTIYGIHFTGNYGFVDSRGFLVVNEESLESTGMYVKRRIEGKFLLVIKKDAKCFPNRCSGLPETLTCRTAAGSVMAGPSSPLSGPLVNVFPNSEGASGPSNSDPVFLHFNFENYRQNYLGKPTKEDVFIYKRVFPPGELNYFYTADEGQTIADD